VTSSPVTVANSAPTAAVSLGDVDPTTDDTLTATAWVTDPDGDATTVVYRWRLNSELVTDASGPTFDLSEPGHGDRGDKVAVTAVPSDDDLKGTIDTDRVTIVNTVPTVDEVTVEPSAPMSDDVLTATAATIDADADPITLLYRWRRNDADITGETAHQLDLSTLGALDGGDRISVVVRASDGIATSAPLESDPVTIGKGVPTVEPVTAAVGHRSAGGVDVGLIGSDPDGDPLSFSVVDAPAHGTIEVDGATAHYTPTDDVVGTDTFTYRASDGLNASAAAVGTVTLTNEAPTATVTLGPSSPSTDDVLVATAGRDDADGDVVSVGFRWSLNGTVVPGATGSTFDLSQDGHGGRGDSVSVDAIPHDGHVEGEPATADVVVANSPPTAGGVSGSVDHRAAGVDITLVGSDPDDDALTFEVVSPPTTGTVEIDGSTARYVPAGDHVGTDTFSYRASDGAAVSAPADGLVTLTNAPPSVTVALDDPTPRTDAVLQASASGSDADGDDVGLVYRWEVDGAPVAGETGPTLDLSEPGNGDEGDPIVVTVTPSDGHEAGTAGTAEATVANAPPSASVTLEPAPPAANAVLTASATGTDADQGDSVSFVYVWTVNGVVRQTSAATSNGIDTFDLGAPGNGEPGDTIAVEVTPNDGTTDGPAARAEVTAAADNQAPVAEDHSMIVAPGTPRTIVLSATDPEGDPVTFEVVAGPANGTLSGSGASHTYTPEAGYTGPDAFTFRARDGISAGPVATVSIVVSRTTNVSVTNKEFRPSDVTIAQGDVVRWSFEGARQQSVTDANALGLLDSGLVARGGTYRVTFVGAGTYRYRSTAHGSLEGSVSVPLVIAPTTSPSSGTFTVTWAAESPPSAFVFDVEYRRPGSSDWLSWRTGVSSVSAPFLPDGGAGTYSFRARLRNVSAGATSDWSSVASMAA
jgi:plastocyanin